MKKNCRYEIVKDIPLGNGKSIKKGQLLTRTHGMYYLEGNMLSSDYQEDFDKLIEHEEVNGWNYIVPLKEKVAFDNSKGDF
jgi:hypothetical protein